MIRSLLAALAAAALTLTPTGAAWAMPLPPDPPRDVTAVAGNASATVAWTASKDPGDLAIEHYDVTADPGPATCESPGDTTTCIVTGLTNGTTYTFTVTATNIEKVTSEPSEPSNAVVPFTVPDPPTLAFVWPADQALQVRWWVSGDGGSPLIDYTATAQPGGQSCTVAATETSCYIGGLTNGQTYSVTVRARNAAGYSASSNSLPNSPYGAPSQARDIQVAPREHAATVSWLTPLDDGGRPLSYYRVDTDGRDCRTVTTSCEVTGLVAGREYRFRVSAVNTGNAASSTANTAPVIPTGGTGGPDGGPTVIGWGHNGTGALGDGTLDMSATPHPAYLGTGLADQDIVDLAAGLEQACALSTGGAVLCWGTGRFTDASSQATTAVPMTGLPGPASDVAVGYEATCALVSGRAYCWGLGTWGQLGTGTGTSSTVPVPVLSDGALRGKTLVSVAAGLRHMCALDDAGAAYCWGRGTSGALGDGTHTDQWAPVAVDVSGVLDGVRLTRITAGTFFTCAAAASGDAYCWGSGSSGQLGNGSNANSPVPVRVGDVAGRDIAAGASHVCAAAGDGTVRCWGWNGAGQLGDGTTTSSAVPVTVATGSAAMITAGSASSCALRADGSAGCWGEGRLGELGNGGYAASTVPVEMALGGRQLVAAAGGQSTFVALAAGLPEAASAVSATAGDARATVTWREPADHGGAIDAYRVTAQPGGATCESATTTCTVSGLTNGTAYVLTVAAHNLVGWGPGTLSGPVTPTATVVAPGRVRGLSVRATARKVRIRWRPTATATGYTYRIRKPHRAYGRWRTTVATRVVLRHPAPGRYRVQVRARNAAGSGPAATARGRVPH